MYLQKILWHTILLVFRLYLLFVLWKFYFLRFAFECFPRHESNVILGISEEMNFLICNGRGGGARVVGGGGGADLLCGHFLAKTYAKTKELDPVGGASAGGAPWIRQCLKKEQQAVNLRFRSVYKVL